MASVPEDLVKKGAKKAASAAVSAVAQAPRRLLSGARMAMLALTGITGGGGYLGYQFFATPGTDLSQPTANAEADKKPSLIPADFVAQKPAQLASAGDAAPWAASKEPAPVTTATPVATESPWSRANNVTPVNDQPIATGPTPPPFAPDAGRRTFAGENTQRPGFNPDTRMAFQPSDPNMSGRMPGSALPLDNDPRGAAGNSLRATSPTVPSTGNSLETRPRTFATTPGLPNTNSGSSLPGSTYSRSLPSNPRTSTGTGQRYVQMWDPCCGVMRCVPADPCGPVTPTNARPGLDNLNKTSTPRRLPADNSASVPPRTTVTPTSHVERNQPTLARPDATARVNTTSTPNVPPTEIVLPDDSYWTIAERVYGDGEYYRALQEFHLARGVRRLEIGDELKMPQVAVLRRMYPQLVPPEVYGPETRAIPLAQVSRTEIRRMYVVAEGDSLRDIAARELGDAARAGEIVERNRPALEQAGYLRPGLELILPSR